MLSKLKHLFLQGENETLFSYFFRLTAFVNLGLSVLYSLFIMFLTTFYDSYVFFILFPTTFFLSLFITGAFGAIQSAKLSTLYQKYQNASVDLFKSDMILLVKLLSKFPAKFACLTYISYLTAGIISIAVLSYMMILPFMTFAILWIFIIIFPALLILRLTQTICSKRTENIISTYFKNDFSISSVSKKGYLGLSVKTQYILYVFLPFLCVCLASSIILFYFSSSLDTINLIKLSISIAIGLIFCTVPSFLTVFFIKKSNSFLQKQIDYIESKKGEADIYIPVDYFSEFSSMPAAINKIGIIYAEESESYKKQTEEITTATKKITEDIDELLTSIDNQINLVRDIKNKIDESCQITKSVDEHITENHRIALQTTNHISFGLNSVKQNITKMQEITEANKFSVTGIRSLSKEINSIWEIVNLISGIADRTKIIAFNAELEASSFDSIDSSFKNVSINIRELANNIMDLTKTIRTQIVAIQTSSHNLIKQGDVFTNHIETGNSMTSDLEETYKSIQDSAQNNVISSEQIKNDISELVQERNALLSVIQKIENTLNQLKEDTEEKKNTVTKIGEITYAV